MVVKDFEDYSDSEKFNLLMNWWHTGDNAMYSYDDMLKFRQAVIDDSSLVFDIVLLLTMNKQSKKSIIDSLHAGRFSEYQNIIRDVARTPEYGRMKSFYEKNIVTSLVDRYNRSPRGAVVSVGEEVKKMHEDIDIELTPDRVVSLFEQVVLNNEDFDEDGPKDAFSIGEGLDGFALFNTDRLNVARSEISRYLMQLPFGEDIPTFDMLSTLKSGKVWTTEERIVEMLIEMGIASELLYYPIEKQDWKLLPDGGPFVDIREANINNKVSGHSPYEYKKYVKGA